MYKLTRVESDHFTDINECLVSPSPCEMSCQNLEGGYACSCPAGFLLNADNSTCRDLDECTAGQHICQQLCINTHGSYKCGCQTGYRQAGDHCFGNIRYIYTCIITSLCLSHCFNFRRTERILKINIVTATGSVLRSGRFRDLNARDFVAFSRHAYSFSFGSFGRFFGQIMVASQ